MTEGEARALLEEIRGGRQLRVSNSDGEWGLRAAGAALITWDHPAFGESIYGAGAQQELSEEEALRMLVRYDAERMNALLFGTR